METVATDFGGGEQMVLNLILAVMVFGLALNIDPREFQRIMRSPKGPLTGVAAQFLLLPAVTFLLTLLVDLDRHDGLVACGVIILCDTGSKGISEVFHARGQDIVETDEDGGLDASTAKVVDKRLKIDTRIALAGRRNFNISVFRDEKVGSAPIFDAVELVAVAEGPRITVHRCSLLTSGCVNNNGGRKYRPR